MLVVHNLKLATSAASKNSFTSHNIFDSEISIIGISSTLSINWYSQRCYRIVHVEIWVIDFQKLGLRAWCVYLRAYRLYCCPASIWGLSLNYKLSWSRLTASETTALADHIPAVCKSHLKPRIHITLLHNLSLYDNLTSFSSSAWLGHIGCDCLTSCTHYLSESTFV